MTAIIIRIFQIGLLSCLLGSLFAQNDFYDLNKIQEIRITFEDDNWDEILDELYVQGNKERLLAQISINGEILDSVGIRFKGFSSVSTDRVKNPFNIKLDYSSKKKYQGIDKIKLGNVIHDPSFVREALSYEIARQYMPAPLANFAMVYVNEELLGVYSNVEAVNKEFLAKHFESCKQPFFKCNPENLSFTGENSNLSDTPGMDTLNYERLYDIESDAGWKELVDFIHVLNNEPDDIEEFLNVDRTLWMHALNYTLLNFDSYIGYAQNYYLYQDEADRFNPILWDLNMSFGSFRITDASGFFDGFTIQEAKTLDPLTHLNSFSVNSRPLMRNLFENATYKKMYLAHIRTIISENFVNDHYLNRALDLQSVIEDAVNLDPNKFYTDLAFESNLYETYQDLIAYPGLQDLMDGRKDYLLNYPGISTSPTLQIVNKIETAEATQSIVISVKTTNATKVKLAYRMKGAHKFSYLDMTMQSNDSWEAPLVMGHRNLEYYIFAENPLSGIFSPERAAYEFHEVKLIVPVLNAYNDIVINEFMATQDVTQADASGSYDDWIELYNNTNESVNLKGLYLSDKLEQPDKWALPDTIIAASDFIIVWADEDGSEGDMHANFKLASGGESISLAYADGTIMDTVTFGEQVKDVATGRLPNGDGPFGFLAPTFQGPNSTSGSQELFPMENPNLIIYPNPSETELYLSFEELYIGAVSIHNVAGSTLYRERFHAKDFYIHIGFLMPGTYALRFDFQGQSILKIFVKK